MPPAHRKDDARTCGATTVVVGQSNTFVDGKLWAVDGDPNSHGAGDLIASHSGVFIDGIKVITHSPDPAAPDNLCIPLNFQHCTPSTAQGSPDTFAYDFPPKVAGG